MGTPALEATQPQHVTLPRRATYEKLSSIMDIPEVVEWGNALGDGSAATQCQHGPVECTVMKTFACWPTCSKYKYSSDALTYLKFMHCFDSTLITTFPADLPPGTVNASFAAKVIQTCAGSLSMDSTALAACAAGDEGIAYFAKEKAKTPAHTGVPFVKINDGQILYNSATLNCPPPCARRTTGRSRRLALSSCRRSRHSRSPAS
eukprot:2989113-Prymnesium_polylepis.1